MQQFKVLFFAKSNGSEPAKDFINTLDTKMAAKMLRTINILQTNGFALREPYSKHLDDGIFELRVKVASDISRVLYFFFHDNKIILTNGFIKKTRKTPPGEIAKAKAYRAEYITAKEN